MRKWYTLVLLSYFVLLTSYTQAQWQRTSTGLATTNPVNSLLINNNAYLAGTSIGVFRSSDYAVNWDTSGTGLPLISETWYANVTVLHQLSGTIFAGTGGNGISASSDNGFTWFDASSGLPEYAVINCLTSINGVLVVGLNTGGIFRSTNNGSSWIDANTGFPANTIPYEFTSTTAGLFVCTYLRGVLRSTDNGASWTQVINGMTSNPAIYSIASLGTDLYAASYGKIYRSTDDGNNWANSSNGLPTNIGYYKLFVKGTKILVGSTGNPFYSTTDNGTNWDTSGTGLPTNTEILTFADDGANIIASIRVGSLNFLYRSTNNGQSWANIPTLALNSAGGTIVGMGNYLHIAALTSTDNGTTWFTGTNPTPGMGNMFKSGNILFSSPTVASANGTFFKSTDHSMTWVNISNGTGLPNERIRSLCTSGSSIFAGTYAVGGNSGIYKSTNEGTSWTRTNSGLPSLTGVSAFAVSGSNIFAGVIWVANGKGVYLSTNDGASWSAVNNGLPASSTINDFAVVGTTIFASVSGSGLYRTTDNGATWNAYSNGLPTGIEITSLISSGTALFASLTGYISSGGGVYMSTNSGDSWTAINLGIPDGTMPIHLGMNDNHIFVGTDAGLFRRPLTDILTEVREINNGLLPSTFQLEQNYPNPFNPNTIIRFSLPDNSIVTLKVYNILGKEVATLFENNNLSQGKYETIFDGSAFASGMYFYRLTASNRNTDIQHTHTKGMILIK